MHDCIRRIFNSHENICARTSDNEMPEKKVNVVKKMMKMIEIVGFFSTNFLILTGAEKYSKNIKYVDL